MINLNSLRSENLILTPLHDLFDFCLFSSSKSYFKDLSERTNISMSQVTLSVY